MDEMPPPRPVGRCLTKHETAEHEASIKIVLALDSQGDWLSHGRKQITAAAVYSGR